MSLVVVLAFGCYLLVLAYRVVVERRPALVAAGPLPVWRPSAVVVRPSGTVACLGRTEGLRLLTHPLVLVGFALALLALFVVTEARPEALFLELTGGGALGLWLPPLVFLAAELCAGRSRRAGAEEMLGAAPAERVRRTLGSCAAALVPAGATLALVLLALAVFHLEDRAPTPSPTAAELLLLPLSVLGAGVLGVMASRWLPWRGAGLLVLVGLVVVSLLLQDVGSGLWLTLVDLVEWETTVRIPGSSALHAAYLLGLSVMAVVGAVYADVRRWRVLLLGAGVTAVTLAIGWLQQ